MAEATLTREDTGEMLPVHVKDDTPPLLAAVQADREDKPITTWDEFTDGLAELRHRITVGLGEADAVLRGPDPVQWADLPPDPAAELAPANLDAEARRRAAVLAPLGQPEQARQGWTPDPPQPWWRRAWGAAKGAVLRVDQWAERLGAERRQ